VLQANPRVVQMETDAMELPRLGGIVASPAVCSERHGRTASSRRTSNRPRGEGTQKPASDCHDGRSGRAPPWSSGSKTELCHADIAPPLISHLPLQPRTTPRGSFEDLAPVVFVFQRHIAHEQLIDFCRAVQLAHTLHSVDC
jgi:hypothetical protein